MNLFLVCHRMTCAAFAVTLLGGAAYADQPLRNPRIGVLMPPLASSPEEGLRQGLRELGYVEGKSIVIEWRRSAETEEQLKLLAMDLARSKVDLIVAVGGTAARAALTATTLPVVLAPVGDAVGSGFAASLAKPGGNSTGVSAESTELIAKRLELLRVLVPRAPRIVFLMNSSDPIGARLLESAQQAARTLHVQLVTLDARNAGELDAALRALPRSEAGGVLVPADLLFLANKAKIASAIRKARLPAMVSLREYHDDGVLMSYVVDLKEAMRRAAPYVDKILRGAKPSELPIEQVSKFELVIDLRVAREMGITVPQELLLCADEVIR